MVKNAQRAHCRAIPDKNGQKRGHCMGTPGNIWLVHEKTGRIAVNAQGQGRHRRVVGKSVPVGIPVTPSQVLAAKKPKPKAKAKPKSNTNKAKSKQANEQPRNTWNGQFIEELD